MILREKGFLFTISIIIFASTLVIFSQLYSSNDVGKENNILLGYSVLNQPLLNENISSNLKQILGFDITNSFEKDIVVINIDDYLPKEYSVSQLMSDYEYFLTNNFFVNVAGTKTINLDNLKDGSAEILFDNSSYTINYDSNKTIFFSNDINSINLDFSMRDYLLYYDFDSSSGDINLVISYNDFNNNFLINDNISVSEESLLNLVFSDANIQIIIGSPANNIIIDSNSSNKLSFELSIKKNFFEKVFPIWFNGFLNYSLNNFSSNSKIKIAN
jgi:hypothetical protein